MGSFHRTNITDEGFIRGAGRLLIADVTKQAWPTKIGDIIELGASQAEIVTFSTLGATGGTFTISVTRSGTTQTTTAQAYNVATATLQTAVQALSNVGAGNALVTGGPGPGTPYIITFASALATTNDIVVSANTAALTGSPNPTLSISQSGDQYRAKGVWQELGATKTGIQIARNNAEEEFDVDQIQGAIASQPTNWEMSVGSALAEVTLDRIQYIWEGGTVTTDNAPATGPEKHLVLGQPVSYTQRRLAVVFQRPNGKIRAYCFRKTQRLPQESAFTHQKTGEQATLPQRWRCLADDAVVDVNARFGEIIDQI